MRPLVDAVISGDDLARWYWTKAELVTIARRLGVRQTGNKAQLAQRLILFLASGRHTPHTSAPAKVRPRASEVDGGLHIPHDGLVCSRAVRTWFESVLGPDFIVDAPLRTFLAGDGTGRTLDDAAQEWAARHASTAPVSAPIGDQFVWNRFVRDWWQSHPTGTRAELLAQWKIERALERPPVD